MTNLKDTIIVLTARSPETILREGGSQSWKLNPVNAKQHTWLVCAQNRHNPETWTDATEPHGTAFLVGRISEIRRSEEEGSSDRWMIAISEYARIDIAEAWGNVRNPVRYTTLEELGIDLDKLKFQAMPETTAPSKPPSMEPTPHSVSSIAVLTITEAKRQLAAAFGIKPDAIEITIRG